MASDYESWVNDVIENFHSENKKTLTSSNSMPFDTNCPLTIFVADKAFGTDDVVAVSLLQLLFENTKVIRTNKKPSTADSTLQTIWINMTRSYDPNRGFFDGHCPEAQTLKMDDAGNSVVGSVVGLGICGQIWKTFGQLIVQKFGAKDEDKYVFRTFYREFLQSLDSLSKSPITIPGSLIYAFNMFNAVGREVKDNFLDAVLAARPVVSRVLQSHVLRGNIYLEELPVMELAFTDRADPELLVLPSRCDSVHLFLKDYDPDQEVKFIIQPRNPDQGSWQVWAVDFKRRKFHIYVPLLLPEEVKHVPLHFVHRGRYLAIADDKNTIMRLAKHSLQAYNDNYVKRFQRWWWDE